MSLINSRLAIHWKRDDFLRGSTPFDWDADAGQTVYVSLTANSVLNSPTNFQLGETLNLVVDPSGFSLTMSWVTTWLNGSTPAVESYALALIRFRKQYDQQGNLEILGQIIGVAVLDIADPTYPTMTEGFAITPFSLAATGGSTPYTYSVQAGSLPAGLSLNSSTGQVTGTPTTAGSGSTTFRVTDNASDTADTSSIGWTVAAGAVLDINDPTYPGMNQGVAITPFYAIASGGTSPYTYSVASGTMPSGVSLNSSTGEISGTPTAAGSGSTVFRVTDNVSSTADSASRPWIVPGLPD